jgi:predicted lipoprotein
MKRILVLSICLSLLVLAGCTKPSYTIGTATEQQVLTDFGGKLVNPNYQDIQAQAYSLNQAVIAFNATPTDANLAVAQAAWRNTRTAWESCEGYLFGPVEDNNYDPSIDTWPLDKTSLDSLLSSSNPLGVSDINTLPFSLKGFHAIEYVIFGSGTAAQVAANTRKMTYLVSLSQSLYDVTTALRSSWDPAQNNFADTLSAAGAAGNAYFRSRKAAFQAIVASMADICDEVGTSKMQLPLGINGQADSTQDESMFSHNSTADFTHNIAGISNAYFSTYGSSGGHSLHELVAANNLQLDNQITAAITDAVGSFSTISPDYELAIYTQKTQIAAVQAKIAALKVLLDTPQPAGNFTPVSLAGWVSLNIKD